MPDHSPLFSVVIPVYNREKMALRAIASVRAQAFNDYEIVVVDDASTDNSLAVMQAHSADDFHVVALAKNRGVSGARNAGVAAAKGQYIVLLDSDDEFLDGMLEEYAKLVRDNPGLDMIWCGTDCQIEDKDGQIAKQYIEIIRADSQRNSSDDRMFAVRLGTGAGIAMKKQRYLAMGGFDENLHVAEDRDFFIRVLEAGLNYCSVNQALVRTHHHQSNSLMNALSDEQRIRAFEAVERVLDKHFDFLTQKANQALFIRLSLVMVNRFYQHAAPAKARLHARRILKIKPLYFKLIKRVIRYEIRALVQRLKL